MIEGTTVGCEHLVLEWTDLTRPRRIDINEWRIRSASDNSERVRPNHSAMNKRCERCDAVLGETDANYCVRCSADASETTNSGSAELAPDVAALHVHWPGGSRVHPLTAPLMTLGRDDSNDIVVDYPTVSRFHAEIHRTDDGFLLVDTDSLSGLRIHGQLVREIELSGGEHIRIGDGRGESVTLAFEAAAQPGEITAPDSPHPTDVQAGRLSLPGRGSAVLGRASDCDLYLDDLSVAGHHARVDARGDKHVLVDLGGRSGTYLNGRRVDGLTDLSNGDVIQIGRTQLSYDGSGLAPSATAGTRTLVAPFRVDSRITAPASPLLIGRDAECGIQLDHPTVSRRHARCERNEESTEACIITDLGSTNGTYVNGGRLRELTRHVLHRGDVVRIGPHKLTLRDGRLRTLSKADGMAIDAVGLTRIVRGEKGQPETILDAVEIVVEPNELVALAGGSGSGKTTLLDALCAFRQSDEGYVRVDGQDLYREKESLRPFIGYVPQSDIVHDSLTTEQALEYVARLRLDLIAEERCVQITHVLGAVDLDERRTTRIDRLSGGQRKRLSTAVELLAEPKLLFLDEPTSGLDPGLDKSMMYTFRRLADEGRTVLLVTHATANIRQCDFVLFLAPGGRLAYFGPPDEALLYFGERDFADIYTRLRNEPIEWDDKYKGSSDYRKYILNRRAEPRITPRSKNKDAPRPWRFLLRQFLVLTQRYLAILRSDKRNLAILLGQAPIIALILFILAKDGILEAYQPDVGGASGAALRRRYESRKRGSDHTACYGQCRRMVRLAQLRTRDHQGIGGLRPRTNGWRRDCAVRSVKGGRAGPGLPTPIGSSAICNSADRCAR